MKGIGLAVFLMLFSYQTIWAITMMHFKVQDLEASSEMQQMTIAADVDKRRLKLQPDTETDVIYRGDLPEKAMYMVDHDEQVTQIVDRKQVQGMSTQMQQMMQQMQAQMKNLPPEVQKQFAAQMNKQATPSQELMGPKPTMKKTNKRDTIANLKCSIYEVRQGSDMMEVCAAPWKKIKNGQSLRGLVQEMLDFQQDMMQSLFSGMPKMGQRPKGMGQPLMLGSVMEQGFPVRVKAFENGKLTHIAELESIKERAQVAPKFYDSPDGYKTRSMMEGGMGSRRSR